MDDDGIGLEWVIEAAACLLLAAAAGWSAFMLIGALAAAGAAALAFVLSMMLLRLLPTGPFRLPAFNPVPWEQLGSDPLELTEPLDPLRERGDAPSRVVRLFPVQSPLPSAGAMRESIERHLRQRQARDEGEDVVLLGADASAALRNALQELKRSLG